VTDCTLYAVLYCILFIFDSFAKKRRGSLLFSSATGELLPGESVKSLLKV